MNTDKTNKIVDSVSALFLAALGKAIGYFAPSGLAY